MKIAQGISLSIVFTLFFWGSIFVKHLVNSHDQNMASESRINTSDLKYVKEKISINTNLPEKEKLALLKKTGILIVDISKKSDNPDILIIEKDEAKEYIKDYVVVNQIAKTQSINGKEFSEKYFQFMASDKKDPEKEKALEKEYLKLLDKTLPKVDDMSYTFIKSSDWLESNEQAKELFIMVKRSLIDKKSVKTVIKYIYKNDLNDTWEEYLNNGQILEDGVKYLGNNYLEYINTNFIEPEKKIVIQTPKPEQKVVEKEVNIAVCPQGTVYESTTGMCTSPQIKKVVTERVAKSSPKISDAGQVAAPFESMAEVMQGWMTDNLPKMLALLALMGSVIVFAMTHQSSVLFIGFTMSMLLMGASTLFKFMIGGLG